MTKPRFNKNSTQNFVRMNWRRNFPLSYYTVQYMLGIVLQFTQWYLIVRYLNSWGKRMCTLVPFILFKIYYNLFSLC